MLEPTIHIMKEGRLVIHFVAVSALLLACSAPIDGQAKKPIEWVEFKSAEGGFSVKFPGTPRLRQDPHERGPISFTRYTHTLLLDSSSFEVDYMDMPAGSQGADIVFEGGVSGFTRPMLAAGGTLLTNETVVRGTCKGRDVTVLNPKSGKPGFARARLFNSGQRYYFIVFVNEKEDNAAVREMAGTFVESFSVKGGCSTAVEPVEAPSGPKKVATVRGTTDPATNWRKIDRQELGFSILMPGVVQYESAQVQVKPIPLMHHTFVYGDPRGVYSVEVFGDYPPKFFSTPTSYLNVLDATVYATRQNLSADGFETALLRDLKVEQFPGREFSVASEKLKARGRAQIFVTDARVYVFIAFATHDPDAAKTVELFFKSVRVSPK